MFAQCFAVRMEALVAQVSAPPKTARGCLYFLLPAASAKTAAPSKKCFMIDIRLKIFYTREEKSLKKQYKPHIMGQDITSNTENIKIKGHVGKWAVVSETTHNGRTVFLLEHETYGDEAAYIAVDVLGNIVCEEIYDDFPECLDY
jgi:hypothetical protein